MKFDKKAAVIGGVVGALAGGLSGVLRNSMNLTLAIGSSIEAKAKERTEIQQKIQQLNEQRKKYVTEEMKKLQKDTDTLGSAIIQAVSEQAKRKNFKIESPEKSLNNEKERSKP